MPSRYQRGYVYQKGSKVLHVTRRLYDGDVDVVKSRSSDRYLPIDPASQFRMEAIATANGYSARKQEPPSIQAIPLNGTFVLLQRNSEFSLEDGTTSGIRSPPQCAGMESIPK
jgi:hypothetical protein